MAMIHELIPLALHASLFLMALAIGLDSGVDETLYVLRRPRLLLRSLLAVVVIVPAVAALLVAALPLAHEVEIAIVLMAIAPLPTIVLAKEIREGGRKAYAYGLLVAVSALAILTVPLVLTVLDTAFGKHAAVSPMAVARLVFGSVFVPVALGMAVRAMAPQAAPRAVPLAGKLANLLLLLAVVPVLIASWPALVRLVGNGTVLAMEAVVAAGLVAGHLLGGPEHRDRIALALSSGTRHPGIAMLIAAANGLGPEVRAAILLFVLVGILTAIPYQMWVKRQVLAPRA